MLFLIYSFKERSTMQTLLVPIPKLPAALVTGCFGVNELHPDPCGAVAIHLNGTQRDPRVIIQTHSDMCDEIKGNTK